MRVGVVSTYSWLLKWDNYGSLLQMYALQAFLKKQGHDAYLIRTIGERAHDTGTGRAWWPRLRTAITRPGAVARRLRYGPKKVDTRRQRIAEFNAKHPRDFEAFMARNISMTEREYTTSELVQNPPHADVYVVGSDQVWAVVSTETFLRFGDEGAKRVAYAVSRKWQKDSAEWRNEAQQAVKGFDAISVREFDGIEVVRQIGRDDAAHVVDPVLLLERSEYEQLIEKRDARHPVPSPFILAYLVNVTDLANVPWNEMQEMGASEGSELKVVPLQGLELQVPEDLLFVPNPAEWIEAFAQCASVITSSYHGMLFAIIMRKPFLVVLLEGEYSLENVRFMSILKRLGLEDRVYRKSESSMAEQMRAPTDWDAVGAKLDAFRSESSRFLIEHVSS